MIKTRLKRGAPYVRRQYIKKAKPKATKTTNRLKKKQLNFNPITQKNQKGEIVQVQKRFRPL